MEALLELPHLVAVGINGELLVAVGAGHPVHVAANAVGLLGQGIRELFFLLDGLIGRADVAGHVFGREDEAVKLFLEDGLQVLRRNLVPAAAAGVLGRVGGDVHLLAAVAEGDARKDLDGLSARALPRTPPLIEDRVALGPELL